jgi:hypothetical protein
MNLKLAGAILLVLVLLASGCGGSNDSASADGTTTDSTETSSMLQVPDICRAASSSCKELTQNDLPDPFGGFPEIQHVYQNERRFDVYTSLSTAKSELASHICSSVLADLLGNPSDPLIVVYTADGIPLANGGSDGCSPIGG